ncbi:hypothetical protein [Tolypothrix sp. VBCCA 56010]|uniref:hypothetical protein n=1 Tax=Tolypothrix sp. VBCCA 56010 TaxID=3137731 RepID=UPI003D7D2282
MTDRSAMPAVFASDRSFPASIAKLKNKPHKEREGSSPMTAINLVVMKKPSKNVKKPIAWLPSCVDAKRLVVRHRWALNRKRNLFSLS